MDDDGGSTTSSDGLGYIGVPAGQKQFPNQPHVGGKTIGGKTLVRGKTFKSMGETSTDNDSDGDEDGHVAFEGKSNDEEDEAFMEDPSNDEETEDEDDIPVPTFPPPQVDKPQVSAPIPVQGEPQSQLEAWQEVHASLTRAVLVAREAIASKKLQRRFWLETICGNLAHPSEVKTTSLPGVAPSDAPPSQMNLLLPHSIWYKPDQRKKKRGSKKQPVVSEEAKSKKPRKKKAAAASVHNKTTLASLAKKKPAKGTSTLKKRKQMLPLKAKKKPTTAALPTKTSKAKVSISVSVDTSKVLPPEAKSAAPVLSVFADDSDDDSEDLAVAMAVETDDNDDSDEDAVIAEADENEESKPAFTLHTFDTDDSSSEDEDDEKKPDAKAETENGPDEDKSTDDNDGPDWNASHQSHPFLKKRRSSINSTTQGTLDSSEIYSTFRPGNEKQEENKQDEAEENRETPSSRMIGMGGFGPFGGSDTSDDEIPF